jgi:hypothetical protein
MSDPKPQLSPVVRLKGDRIILKLGSESCELTVVDGLCDDAAQFAKVIQKRIQEVLAKRGRDPERLADWTQDHTMHAAGRTARFEADLIQTIKTKLK